MKKIPLSDEQKKLQERFVKDHLPLAKRLAKKLCWPTQEVEECHSQALYGLTVAANRLATHRKYHPNPTAYISMFIRHYIYKTRPTKDCAVLEYGPMNYTQSEEEAESRIEELIEHLACNQRERSICRLRVSGRTDGEIAAILDMSKTRVHEIRRELQQRIKNELGR